MSTTFPFGPQELIDLKRHQGRKNGRRISLISHAAAAAYTWATPQKITLPSEVGRHDA